ncbi:MAG: penicillin-binding transpeptidase domain-containing protein, partial [Acutalibacteraceae bacterium]
SELNLIECATLAGITKAPYSLNPYVNYDKCIERQQTCLWYMHDQGKITDNQYNKALKSKIKLLDQKSSTSDDEKDDEDILSWYDEYVIDQVIADLQSEYGYEYNEAWRMVYYGGLSIYSAVDLDMQEWLESVYKDRLGFPSAGRDSKGNLPQSSMTIMDYQGRIVALVGGTGEKTTNRAYNRATDNRAKRQPGSSIKPLSVYAPAIDTGIISPSSTILEKAITADGRTWPRNFNGDYGSGDYVTVENALVRSLNTVPARILKEMLGLETSYEYCNEKFKLHLSDTDIGLSQLAVGGTNTGVTTLEMAAAFATFGNGGQYYKAYSYYKVLDRNGEVLLDNTKNEAEQVIKPETAQAMLGMMTKAVTQSNGTAYGSKISGFQTFAKTGTTSDNCDKWYCGGTPYYVASVWYGYDYRSNLYTGGSNPSKTIFRYVFEEIHDGLKEKTFDDVLEEVGIDKDSIGKIDTGITVKSSDEDETEEITTTTAPTTESTTEKKNDETTKEKTTKAPSQEQTTEAPSQQQTTKSTTVPSTTVPTTAPSTEAPTQPATSESPKVSDTTHEQKTSQKDDDDGGDDDNPEVIW